MTKIVRLPGHSRIRSRVAARWEARQVLLAARQECGMTREEFAHALGSLLDIPELTAAAVQAWEEGKATVTRRVRDAAATLARMDIPALLNREPDPEETVIEPPDNSEGLSALAAAATASTPTAVLRGLDGGRIGIEVTAWADEQVETLSRLDDLLGGVQVLRLAEGDMNLLLMLRKQATYEQATARSLNLAIAQVARLAGWLASDAGYHDAAQRYWQIGIEASRSAGDHDFAAHLLAYLALQAGAVGQPLAAVHLLEGAKQEARRTNSLALQALLDGWQVHPYALLGDGARSAHLLNRADDLWDRRHTDDDPPWLYWMFRPSLNPESGRAFITLGEPAIGERLLSAGLRALPPEFRRDQMLYLLGIAEARRNQPGRMDEALTSAMDAATMAASIDSPRARERLIAFAQRLRQDEPTAKEFLEYLRDLTEAGNSSS
jgi:transcriptional regulator with XRE-family HTH domain